MKIGEAIIFKSNKAPHTAILNDKIKIPRKSIEFRCLVFNFDREKSDNSLNKIYKSKNKQCIKTKSINKLQYNVYENMYANKNQRYIHKSITIHEYIF